MIHQRNGQLQIKVLMSNRNRWPCLDENRHWFDFYVEMLKNEKKHEQGSGNSQVPIKSKLPSALRFAPYESLPDSHSILVLSVPSFIQLRESIILPLVILCSPRILPSYIYLLFHRLCGEELEFSSLGTEKKRVSLEMNDESDLYNNDEESGSYLLTKDTLQWLHWMQCGNFI